MSGRKCVSAKLVFDDGTVDHAEGEEALVVDGVLRQQCIDRSYWTTTRPLRKTTKVRGQVCDPRDGAFNVWGDESDGGRYPRIDVRFLPGDLLDGRAVDLTITVEAEAVSERRDSR